MKFKILFSSKSFNIKQKPKKARFILSVKIRDKMNTEYPKKHHFHIPIRNNSSYHGMEWNVSAIQHFFAFIHHTLSFCWPMAIICWTVFFFFFFFRFLSQFLFCLHVSPFSRIVYIFVAIRNLTYSKNLSSDISFGMNSHKNRSEIMLVQQKSLFKRRIKNIVLVNQLNAFTLSVVPHAIILCDQ